MRRLVALLAILPMAALAADTYEIEAAGNDEKFVLDGEFYEAKTYCLGWEEGDQVVFVDGTAGACSSAVLYNKRLRKTCEVWCE